MENCRCYECLGDTPAPDIYGLSHNIKMRDMIMVVCAICGNKRCPHGTDHRLPCTNSNEPGQLGSRYGIYPHPYIELIDFMNKGGEENKNSS